jgi:carboxylate-amine ligase
MCDMPGNLDDTLALAALIHCLVKALSDDIDQGAYQHDCHPMLVRQNKWRAARYGLGAQLVDASSYQTQAVRAVVEDLVGRLRMTADELGCSDYLDHCRRIAAGPSWADRQLALADETGSLNEVVWRLTRQARITPREQPTGDSKTVPRPHFPTKSMDDAAAPAL